VDGKYPFYQISARRIVFIYKTFTVVIIYESGIPGVNVFLKSRDYGH